MYKLEDGRGSRKNATSDGIHQTPVLNREKKSYWAGVRPHFAKASRGKAGEVDSIQIL